MSYKACTSPVHPPPRRTAHRDITAHRRRLQKITSARIKNTASCRRNEILSHQSGSSKGSDAELDCSNSNIRVSSVSTIIVSDNRRSPRSSESSSPVGTGAVLLTNARAFPRVFASHLCRTSDFIHMSTDRNNIHISHECSGIRQRATKKTHDVSQYILKIEKNP